MTYQAGLSEVVPPMVGPFTFGWSLIATERVNGADPVSGSWFTADAAMYWPVLVPATCTAKRLWWANGSTVSASYNLDCGIYLDAGYKPGTKIISTGSTAQGTASQVQFVDITDTTLAPGLYWLALACSSGSATTFRLTSGVAHLDAMVSFSQTSSAFPLPASATPIQSSTFSTPVFGFATTASP